MINFKDREDQFPALLSVASIIVAVGAGAFILFTMVRPGTTIADLDKSANAQRTKIFSQKKDAQKKLSESQITIDADAWFGDPEYVITDSMKEVSAAAQSHKIKLVAFRPQNAAVADDLNTIPYLVTVEGPFAAVLDFERELDTLKSKLGVSLIQVNSADPNTDRVTANIGLVAYLKPTPPAPPVIKTKSTAPTSLDSSSKEKTSRA